MKDNTGDFDEVYQGWKKVLATIDSLTNSPYESSTNGALPIILSKIEKFALSLKDLQESDECCKPSMCSISSINSLDDVEKTLKVFGVRSFPGLNWLYHLL